jgi:hypothetical protein
MQKKLSPAEVAVLLCSSRGTLANWRSHGEGPPFIRVGKRKGKRWKILYDAQDLEKWLQRYRVKTIDTIEDEGE